MKNCRVDKLMGLLNLSENISIIERALILAQSKKANNEGLEINGEEIDLNIISNLLNTAKEEEESRIETYMDYLIKNVHNN